MNYAADSRLCLTRILNNLDLTLLTNQEHKVFIERLDEHFDALFDCYTKVYGGQYDCFYHLQNLVENLAKGFKDRKTPLKRLDGERRENTLWYRDENQVGMACYVDLLGPRLHDLITKIPYFKSLGITYLHLMPLYESPEGDSDGGYAVSNYRKVNPTLGSMSDLRKLANALQQAGISLVLDFVFNHTSDEHEWAKKALKGDPTYQQYYYLFDDKSEPDEYEQSLREIFPQVRRGNFTWNDTMQKWVWTTFNSFQWDLNYANPEVFNAITAEMLFLANIGCAALRLDALAFIWKDKGTNCENQPFAHTLIQAFNRCLQIVAPAVVFKSEAIVHPDEVVKYIDKDECQLSYNPLLMALIWNSLATRKTRLLNQSMRKSFTISEQTTWVNYVRCHDDIGWTFDDDVAYQLGINPHDHRHFLNQFYTGRFDGTFSNGVPFGENPSTGDCRVCGSLASLCGLEAALQRKDQSAIDVAIKRIMLVHGIIFSIGGIPLLYSGDELGLLNDYDYANDADKTHDARWVHRLSVEEEDINLVMAATPPPRANLHQQTKLAIFNGLQQLIEIRKQHPIFGEASTEFINLDNQHCFGFVRHNKAGEKLAVLVNFSEHSQVINIDALRQQGFNKTLELVGQTRHQLEQTQMILTPYDQKWLLRQT